MSLDQTRSGDKEIRFFPDHVRNEAILAYVLLIVLVVIALALPPELGEKANPLDTPEHIKPEWYFMFFYQFLKYIPPNAAVLITLAGIAALFALPFWDRSPERHPQKRVPWMIVLAIVIIGIIVLTILGEMS